MEKKQKNNEVDLTKDVGEGDIRMVQAIINSQGADGKIDWKKVNKNLNKIINDNRSPNK
jgi:hypothetical protein